MGVNPYDQKLIIPQLFLFWILKVGRQDRAQEILKRFSKSRHQKISQPYWG